MQSVVTIDLVPHDQLVAATGLWDIAVVVDPLSAPEIPDQLDGGVASVAVADGDIVRMVEALASRTIVAPIMLACMCNDGPITARVGAWSNAPDAGIDRILFAPTAPASGIRSGSMIVAGMMIRKILDELDRPAVLTDAAGIAVSLAFAGSADIGGLLASSARGKAWVQSYSIDSIAHAASSMSTPIVAALHQQDAGVWSAVRAPVDIESLRQTMVSR